jgi:prefoldin subunit 5
MELLLEDLIRMQGKLNEKLDRLSSRMNQVEFALSQTPPHDQTTGQESTITV